MLVSNNSTLNIFLANNSSQLKELLSQTNINNISNMIDLDSENFSSLKDISKLLKELINSIKDGSKSNINLENLFKNSDIFKNLGTLASNLSQLLKMLDENKNLSNLKISFEPFLKTLKDINNLNIKDMISNSGIFLENKLLNSSKFNLDFDLKANLLKIQEFFINKNDANSNENLKVINNLLSQIELSQIASIALNSNFIVIPFLWDLLEDGFIQMKQKEENKFFCQINLNLKEFGKLELMLFLYEKNRLDITIYAENKDSKSLIRKNISKLKEAFKNIDLVPINIKILDLKIKSDNIFKNFENIESEFTLSNKINIRV
ncbi:flagellar hook-length control protein FliK [Aliarcobacter thereius]|uniref:Flagellar hook-length control protein FliK n=2 Tax=Aliarcobacter thereius TaxID=544718 RepID=A0A1C0B5Q3_9BACT|nr:flagellar hook-length control protein FliK [Aliarcobacter thereius]OCL95902.1 Flagellar hook-length control protein FliK [Aliarcobacter thereius LMG 24486]OCL98194.1 Flagellar hook-length control protein FliK [Aliarcobacter thereius]QBF16125.1 flagellar hook-length control protein FliK [Aliarcobacter thereius LMG 24486]TLS94537.1 flagellar hook-length control protein FliK [Aliarcobacter thereius]